METGNLFGTNQATLVDVENYLTQRSHLEKLIFHLSSDNFEETKRMLPNFDSKYIQQLISSAGNLQILHYKILGDLFELTGPNQLKFYSGSFFARYLFVRGLIMNTDFYPIPPKEEVMKQIGEYENPIQQNTLEWFIKNDDLEGFKNTVSDENIDINDVRQITINGIQFNYIIEFVCYCNALNILKHLISNNVEANPNAILFSAGNGSDEMVEFLSQKGYLFDNTLGEAVSYHNNSIGKWLYEHFSHHSFEVTECVESLNTGMILALFNNLGMNVNTVDSWDNTLLHVAVRNRDIVLVKYLLLKGCDPNLENAEDRKAIDYAGSDNSIRQVLQSAN